MADKLKVAVLISGRGSNMEALIAAAQNPDYPAEIVLVFSNKAEAPGLEKAKAAGIATAALDHRSFDGRESFDRAMHEVLQNAGAELICLAGFMRLLSQRFVELWHNRIINIHPSLLPSFKGAHAHRDVLAAGVQVSGCTVHFVRPEMDEGPILAQAVVPVLADDNESTLAARVLIAEHKIYPMALKWIALGKVRIDGSLAKIDGIAPPDSRALALFPPSPDK